MNLIIFIIIGLAGVLFGRWLALRRVQGAHREQKYSKGGAKNSKHIQEGYLAKINKEKREKKEAAKRKILEFIKQNGRITNDGVERIAGVSDATATRYLDELESENLIIQRGITSGSFYELK